MSNLAPWRIGPSAVDGEVLKTLGGVATWAPDSGGSAALPWFDVTDYGAIGDGITDDRAAIQDALDAAGALAAAAGGPVGVYAPAGTYRIVPTDHYGVTVPSGVHLFGDGYGSHLTIATGAALAAGAIVHTVMIGTNSTPASRARVRDLRVTGNHSAYASGGRFVQGIAARLDAAPTAQSTDVTVERCWVYDTNVGIGSCKTGDGGGQETAPRLASHFLRWSVRDNHVEDTTNKAIELQEADDSKIWSNRCVDVFDGVQALSYCRRVGIVDNWITYRYSGVNVSEGSSHIVVAFNHATGLAGGEGSRGAMVLRREPFTGAVTSECIDIIGNHFDGSATTSSRAFTFETRPGNTGATWRSVRFLDNTFTGDVLLYDITSQTASTGSDLLLTGNTFIGQVTTGASWVSTGTLFRDNTFRTAHTCQADDYRYLGNLFEAGLTIAATADRTIVKDNRTTALTDNGTGTIKAGNIVGGVYAPDTETIRDTMGATLVAGSGVHIVVDDAADTITISAQVAELLVQDGTTPPEALTTEDQTDFLYEG